MTTQRSLTERELEDLFNWLDSQEIGRVGKNISRHFSDGTGLAQIIHKFFPKMIELHNYPQANSVKAKLTNWKTLQTKVLSKMGIILTDEDCRRIASSAPGATEALLFEFKCLLDQHLLEKQDYELANNEDMNNDFKDEREISKRMHKSSKIVELREILSLIKDKVSLVQRSIERKDAQIRELEEIIKNHTT